MKHCSVTIPALLLVFGTVAVSCGPTRTATSIGRAKDALYEAKLVGADDFKAGERYDTKAQYNYFLAVEYLEKSKIFQGFSEFDAADNFASKAAILAMEAVKLLEDQKRLIEKKCVQPKMGDAQ
ncbi:MAG: hypothetical protein ABIK09_20490 [Pseudomonadota bacterium]